MNLVLTTIMAVMLAKNAHAPIDFGESAAAFGHALAQLDANEPKSAVLELHALVETGRLDAAQLAEVLWQTSYAEQLLGDEQQAQISLTHALVANPSFATRPGTDSKYADMANLTKAAQNTLPPPGTGLRHALEIVRDPLVFTIRVTLLDDGAGLIKSVFLLDRSGRIQSGSALTFGQPEILTEDPLQNRTEAYLSLAARAWSVVFADAFGNTVFTAAVGYRPPTELAPTLQVAEKATQAVQWVRIFGVATTTIFAAVAATSTIVYLAAPATSNDELAGKTIKNQAFISVLTASAGMLIGGGLFAYGQYRVDELDATTADHLP